MWDISEKAQKALSKVRAAIRSLHSVMIALLSTQQERPNASEFQIVQKIQYVEVKCVLLTESRMLMG
jgi:hypothetical protein